MTNNERPHSPRRIWIGLGLLAIPSAGLAFAAAATGFQSKARDTLFRCIDRGSLVTMTAIVVQKGTTASCPPTLQMKIAQDRNGNKAVTILQPMSSAGIKSVKKDGKMSQYNPDENRVLVQPAPKFEREEAKVRMGLADQNYKFSLEPNGMIAGQETVVVTATPKYPDLPVRRYSIDIEKDVLLRLELIDEGGKKSTVFDTQAVWYPNSLPDETFELKTIGRVRVINVPGPTRIDNPTLARMQTGIDFALPKELPFGFVVRDPLIAGDEGKRYIAVRITDGLLMATVYQWDRRLGEILGRDEMGVDRFVGGLRIRLVGDLPQVVHHRLMDLFVKEAGKVFRPDAEPMAAAGVLSKGRKPRSDGGRDSADGSDEPDSNGNPVDEALMQTLASFLTALQANPNTL